MQHLLDRGADIEKSNQVGMTPLHHAAKNGHAVIVRILVQRGAKFQKLTYVLKTYSSYADIILCYIKGCKRL